MIKKLLIISVLFFVSLSFATREDHGVSREERIAFARDVASKAVDYFRKRKLDLESGALRFREEGDMGPNLEDTIRFLKNWESLLNTDWDRHYFKDGFAERMIGQTVDPEPVED